jgi:hypothetical protein
VFDVNFHHLPQHEWSVILVFCGPHPRITRQKGLFTIQGAEDKAVNDLVPRGELISHFVPAELKQALLEVLYTMGIDRSTLFPDPDGLCARINWETKNRIERDFPPVSGARIIYPQLPVMMSTSSATITPRFVKAAPED